MLVAFDGELPVGLVLAHELPRRHGDRSKLFVYEVDVAESHWRRGIGAALLARLAELARERASGSASSSPTRTTSRRTPSTTAPAGHPRPMSYGRSRTGTTDGAASGGRGRRRPPVEGTPIPRSPATGTARPHARRDGRSGSRAEVEAWIVEEAGEPVGYLQVHSKGSTCSSCPRPAVAPSARTPPAPWRGISHERGGPRDGRPLRLNESAVRAWERAGFVEVSRHEAGGDYTAPWILMEFRD